MSPVNLTPEDLRRVQAINEIVPGYSGPHHYAFFKGVFEQFPKIEHVLILGVYQGRDICFMCDVLKRYHPDRKVWITGVDKFSDTPCGDWPKDKMTMTWGEAGFGTAPTIKAAYDNLKKLGFLDRVFLIKEDDEVYLGVHPGLFDFIYVDTSHEYECVSRQIRQIPKACAGTHTIIAGDDYSDAAPMPGANWGVRSAVRDGFTDHDVFAEWIWISDASKLKT